MKICVDKMPETKSITRVTDNVNEVIVRLWFETEENVEIKLLAEHDKEKDQIIKMQELGIEYWKQLAERNPNIDYAIENRQLKQEIEKLKSEVSVGEFWHSAYQGKQLEYDAIYKELRETYDKIAKIKQQARNEFIDDIIAIGETRPLYAANKHGAYKMLIIDRDELDQLRNKESK